MITYIQATLIYLKSRLKKLSGDSANWKAFIESFDAPIHSNTHLSNLSFWLKKERPQLTLCKKCPIRTEYVDLIHKSPYPVRIFPYSDWIRRFNGFGAWEKDGMFSVSALFSASNQNNIKKCLFCNQENHKFHQCKKFQNRKFEKVSFCSKDFTTFAWKQVI